MTRLKKATVVVAGGTGNVGSHLVPGVGQAAS
jgi:hypothetical protein